MSIKEQFEQIRQQHQDTNGATIGDGMKTTAKAAAWLGGITLLLQSAPVIIGLLGGCFFLFRGCLTPSVTPVAIKSPAQSFAQAPNSTGPDWRADRNDPIVQQSRRHQFTNPPISNFFQSNARPRQATSAFNDRLDERSGDSTRGLQEFGLHTDGPSFTDLLAGDSRPVLQHENNPLYSMQRGGVFEGFSQMPSQPSRRCRLSFDTIQDGGRFVSCRMSTTSGNRITKTFEGHIEGVPPQLKLRPKVESGNIPFPNYGTPWHARNTAPRITLEFTENGKLLFGTGSNQEVYEFVAKTKATRQAVLESRKLTGGVTNEIPAIKNWQMVSQNGQAMPDHHWHFEPVSLHEGKFTWLQNDEIKMQGSYSEQPDKGRIDLVPDGERKPFRGLMKHLPGQPDRIQLCLSKKRSGRRPVRISAEQGHVFEFTVIGGEE